MRKDDNNEQAGKPCTKVVPVIIAFAAGLTVLSGCGHSSATKDLTSEPNSNRYASEQKLE